MRLFCVIPSNSGIYCEEWRKNMNNEPDPFRYRGFLGGVLTEGYAALARMTVAVGG
jgi:hypothetical protein